MKKYFVSSLLVTFLMLGCASFNSMDSFYSKHKNDENLTSFQVPSYVRSLLKNASPELNELFKNVKDFRVMSFNDCSPAQSQQIKDEINGITKNYKDVLRKNENNTQSFVAVKEKGDVIKDVVMHKTEGNNHYILNLKGNFDPERIQSLIDKNELDGLLKQ
ncbi:MAG: DUF4252 domain-containing protein [Flavobacteriaceae bacterium]|nr:DUF4252 domain-containing protein [Flavobacteriaceae bacterium]